MLKLSCKIWMLANLVVFLVFVISLFPQGFKPAAQALMYSSLFSLPAIFIIYLLLRLLKFLHSTTAFSWMVFLLATGLTAYCSFYLFNLLLGNEWKELNFLLPLSLLSGYAAVLFLSPALHYLFQKFQYENETQCY